MIGLPRRLRSTRGMALPLALFTLVIAAVMITAVFYVARLEQRMGDNSLATTQAFEAAETGAAATLSGWDATAYGGLSNGATVTLPTVPLGRNARYQVTVRRVNSTLFLIRSEGQFLVDSQVITRRQVGRLARYDPPELDPHAAVAARRAVQVSGAAQVDGHDLVPPGWGGYCPSPGSPEYGIRDSVGTVTITAPCTAACITGAGSNPSVLTDPVQSDANFQQWGNLTYNDLTSLADKVIVGAVGTLGAVTLPGPPASCDASVSTNWGDPANPSSPCGDYFPVIYAPGDLTLTDGWGQGTLLVDGDLHLTGPVHFFGAVIVKGSLVATDGSIVGSVTLDNVTATPTSIDGTSTVTYSRCALNRAAGGAGRMTVLSERSWVQLY